MELLYMNNFCGLDFGTSNSTLGFISGIESSKSELVSLEAGKDTLPSAIFFSFENDKTFFGREAIHEYVDGELGRLMRSLKSVLGTPLMHDTTQVKSHRLVFVDIITKFLAEMKKRAEENTQQVFDKVVMGRPVHFIDDDSIADKSAQDALESAAKKAGFKEVVFQYEPIAAALDYECNLTKEEVALIVDLGGGTSDFSVVRISPERKLLADRKSDILSNGGVHIGGTDFDRKLSLHSIMPDLGLGSPYKDNSSMAMPTSFYHDLATWHKIHFLYERKVLISLKSLAMRARDKHLIERLMEIVENKEGHRLAIEVENAKIKLTSQSSCVVPLGFVESGLEIVLNQSDLHDAIDSDVGRIVKQVKSTVADSGLKLSQITKVFMTGGSTAIPLVRNSITALFPNIEIVDGNRFGSVGLGLTVDAQRKFG